MTGRAEVDRQRRRLDAAFGRASGLRAKPEILAEPEILADFARYLCVLVSGFLEQSVIELLLEHVRTHSGPTVLRHVERRLRRFTTATAKNVAELVGGFDPDWRRDLEAFLVDERKAALDSIVNLRQNVSHGRPGATSITLAGVRSYYDTVKKVVEHIADLCLPRAG